MSEGAEMSAKQAAAKSREAKFASVFKTINYTASSGETWCVVDGLDPYFIANLERLGYTVEKTHSGSTIRW